MKNGGRWCWSLDDDYLSIPDWNGCQISESDKGLWYLYRECAQHILVSTDAIADQINKPNKVLVAHNLMDVDAYYVSTPAPKVSDKPITIGWSGSSTHSGDLAIIDDAVCEIVNKYGPDKVDFVFVGDSPRRAVRDFANIGVTSQGAVSQEIYPKLMRAMHPHIMLAPLRDVQFNLSKSNIRILEGWALASAVISSPVGEYKIIDDDVDGLYATTTEDWVTQMSKLIDDEQLRLQLAINGRTRVEQYNWRNPMARNEWRTVINKLADYK